MNAAVLHVAPEYDATSMLEDAKEAPSDFSSGHPENVRLSSRGLGWTVLNFERREAPPAARALPHGSTEHLIFVSLGSGRIVRESDDQRVEHELAPGFVAVVPSETPVRWEWIQRISFSVITLQPSFVDRVASEVFRLKPEDYRLRMAERQSDNVVTNIAGVLAREVVRGEPGSRLYAESLANILAVHLLRHYATCADGRVLESCWMPDSVATASLPAEAGLGRTAGHSRPVADALRFIHENYASELSLNAIAEAAHLSPFHLARLFKQALGVSPHQYLIQVRVNSARALLSAGSGERSLAEVASAVGFADQSHLTRHFKRIMGVTPRQFRA
jgi:AraC family transcriptional regulator